MPLRVFLTCLLGSSLLLLTGCAALEPNHVTVQFGRDEAETANDRHARVRTNRSSVALTWDLPRR